MAVRQSAISWVNKWYFPSYRKSNIRNGRFHSWSVVIRSMSPSGAVDRKMWLNIAKQTWMHRLKCTANEWEAPSFCECLLRYKIPQSHCFNDQSCVAERAKITRATATWSQDSDMESSLHFNNDEIHWNPNKTWMKWIPLVNETKKDAFSNNRNGCYSEWKIQYDGQNIPTPGTLGLLLCVLRL